MQPSFLGVLCVHVLDGHATLDASQGKTYMIWMIESRGLFFKAELDLEVNLIFIVNIDDLDEVKLNLGLNSIVKNWAQIKQQIHCLVSAQFFGAFSSFVKVIHM